MTKSTQTIVAKIREIAPWILILTPIAVQVVYIIRFAVNVPFGDEWEIAHLLYSLHSGNLQWSDLWKQNAENRPLVPRVATLALAELTRWNVIVEMYVGLLLACLSLLGLWLIYKRMVNGSLQGFVPVAWLFLSLGQWENILWGWKIETFLMTLGVIWAIYFLSFRSLPFVALACLLGALGSFSFSAGLLIWPVGLSCLIALKAPWRGVAFWGLVGSVVLAAYFNDYIWDFGHPSPLLAFDQPRTTFAFLRVLIGAPLGGGSIILSSYMGIGVVTLLGIFLFQKLWAVRKGIRISKSDVVLGSLVLFSFLSSIAITFGRVGFGRLDWATSSRYISITSLGIIGAYLLFMKSHLSGTNVLVPSPRFPRISLYSVFLPIVLIGITINDLYGLYWGYVTFSSRLRQYYVLQTFDMQSNDAFYPKIVASNARVYAPFLKQQRLSVFSEPVEFVLLPPLNQDIAIGEILPERPVVQRLKCPVQTLKDLRILVGTFARNNTSRFDVKLTEGNEQVLQRTFSSVEIEDNSWLSMDIPQPIERCNGRELILEIKSSDASPGNAITLWAYPRYFEGELLKPAEPSFVNRVIGIELNAKSSGLVR